MSSRYGGYQPYTQRHSVLTWAPGQGRDVHNKFHAPGVHVPVPDASTVHASAYATSSTTLTKAHFADLASTRKRDVALLPMDKPAAQHSVCSAGHSHFGKEGGQLRDISDVSLSAALAQVDGSDAPVALTKEVLLVIRRAFTLQGGTLSDRQARVLTGLIAPHPHSQRWSLSDIRTVLSDAADYLDEEVRVLRPDVAKDSINIASKHRETQEATLRGALPTEDGAPVPATLVLHGPAPASRYQIDVGKPGTGPHTRPLSDSIAAGMYQTTRDLLGGTSRQSKHVPGYQGHIPSYTYSVAAEQGLGSTTRDTFHSKTLLASTFTRRVPGYTGFLPDFDVGDTSEVKKPSGRDAATEAAAADHLVTQYWAARAAAATAAK